MNLTLCHDSPVHGIAATALVLLLSLTAELIGGDVSTDLHPRPVDPPVIPLVSRWTTPVGLEFVLIPPSTFTVPDPVHKGERLTVETSAFYSARHVVTKGLFARFMKEVGKKPTRNIERSNRTEFGDADTLASACASVGKVNSRPAKRESHAANVSPSLNVVKFIICAEVGEFA